MKINEQKRQKIQGYPSMLNKHVASNKRGVLHANHFVRSKILSKFFIKVSPTTEVSLTLFKQMA